MKQVMQVKLDDGQIAYAEVEEEEGIFEEIGNLHQVKEVSSEYLKVVKNVMNNLRSMENKPDSVEMEFGIKLSAAGGKALAWIVADASAEADLRIKMKWETPK